MAEFVSVAVDAMGGDYAPAEIVKGAVDAINEKENIKVVLLGQEDAVNAELSKYTYDKDRVEVVNCTDVIEMAEAPVNAIRKKKDSSIVKGMQMTKEGKTHGYVSAGSTGANLVGGTVLVGRIKGVERSPLAPLIPTATGVCLLIDCGANVDARPSHLVQFAKMGSIYMESVVGIKNPRVALVSNGEEEEKGNALTKETYPLLKECTDINFIGNVEARSIPEGACDVAVCEAFTGNAILKTYEGVGALLLKKIKGTLMKNLKTKIGALLIKSALKETMKEFDIDQYGGAPMLGLNGLVVKTHGNSKAKIIRNSIFQCATFAEQHVTDKIREEFSPTSAEE
ncbi:MAG: phosphate acyltransferase PlsX [Lachnospiraceae bacterium]|nr:phosphate acyltransferase PlsX [Lachnospiraceae bacterium]